MEMALFDMNIHFILILIGFMIDHIIMENIIGLEIWLGIFDGILLIWIEGEIDLGIV